MKFCFDTFLFDVDGTVFLSEKSHFLSFKEVLEKYDISISEEFFFYEALGMNSFQIFKKLTSFSDDKIFSLIEERNKIFLEKYCGKIDVVDGFLDFLNFLEKNNFKIAFVTNGTNVTSKCMLRKFNINHLLLSSDEIKNPKPDPEGYLKALKLLNSDSFKSDNSCGCVVFEDTVNGIKAGLDAGCKVVGVKSFRNSEKELLSFGANIVISSFNDFKLLEFLGLDKKLNFKK